MARGIPNRRIYTMAELAEDAGHMGYSHDYYPGSKKWNDAHRKNRLVDVTPAYKQGELFDSSRFNN